MAHPIFPALAEEPAAPSAQGSPLIAGPRSLRALVLAPGDGEEKLAAYMLTRAGVPSAACESLEDLVAQLTAGAGAAVIAEEALVDAELTLLAGWVAEQPSWSDFPFIVLTLRSTADQHPLTERLTEVLGNVTFLERPFHPFSLVSLVRSAVRGRRRQYEARALIEELRLGQEQLRFAQDAGRIGAFELEPATGQISVSPEFCRLWGVPIQRTFPLSDLIGLIEPEDRDRVRSLGPDMPANALDYLEFKVRRPNTGEVRWIARQGERIVDATGAPRFFGVTYDITERRRAEEALRESEARFRLIADSAPIPMWVTKLDRKREFVNRAYMDFLGLTYEEALDFDWRTIIHPDDIQRIMAEQIEKEAALKPFSLEARYLGACGEYRWMHSESQPRWDGEGRHIGFIGIAYDITQSKKAADDLRDINDLLERQVAQRTVELVAQGARLRAIFETSFQLQGLVAPDGTLLEANQPFLQALGAAPEAVIGRPFTETPWCARMPGASEAMQDAIAHVSQGGAFREEMAVELPGGVRTFDFSMRPMPGAGDGRSPVIFEAIDLSERRAAEEQLRQASKMEAVGQLTGGIAHDFNNLLTGITGSLDLIRRRMDAGRMDGIARFMDAAINSAQRAAALTHRLLAFARRQSLDTKPAEIGSLIAGTADILRRTLGEQITLETKIGDGLWQAMTDANQFESALLNLAINARDAMPHGGRLTIAADNARIEAMEAAGEETPGDYVRVSVSDTGTGMEPDVVAKAFDPFFTTKPIGHGTGLGLSMVYGFLKQSGGFVRIASTPGIGTTVQLFLRRADRPVIAPAPSTPESPRGRGEVLLVVEDEPSVRLLMTQLLEELGYRTIEAPNAPVALAVLRSTERIDLLVTDVGLPEITGRQLADMARETRPDLKVLFVTGYAEDAARSGFLGPGMEIVTKPFLFDELAQRIRTLIGETAETSGRNRPADLLLRGSPEPARPVGDPARP